ncbi:MAG TPA: APC family permease [Victivallales bacterium]|nr:APC family permease [Victivallales bacterium]
MAKKIRISDIVFMNVVALLGVRWFATAGQYGAASIILWVLAAFLYFVPMSYIFAELSTVFPDTKGGFVDWVKEILGEETAFCSAWFYFVANLFYYPTILTFAAVCIAYPINPELAQNKVFITIFVIVFVWVGTLINIRGVNVLAIFAKFGGIIGNIIPIIVLIILAFITVFIYNHPIPTNFSFEHWIPNLNTGNLLFLCTLTFAMAGGEITSPFAANMRNPKRDFATATLISALLVSICYIIGTVALTLVLKPADIGAANGIIAVVEKASRNIDMVWLASVVAVLITIAGISGTALWMAGSIRMFVKGNDEKYVPAFMRKNNKNDIASNALILQALIVTFIFLLTACMSSVESIYIILILMTTIQLFIVYVIIIAAYYKLKFKMQKGDKFRGLFESPGKKTGAFIICFVAMVSTVATILIPIFSVPADTNILVYEIEIIGGPIVFLILALWIIRNAKKKHAKKTVEN